MFKGLSRLDEWKECADETAELMWGFWENVIMCKCVQERKSLELADKIAKLLWEPVMNQCDKQRSLNGDDCSAQPSTGLVPRWQRRGKLPFFGPQVWGLQWKPQLHGILTSTLAGNCQARQPVQPTHVDLDLKEPTTAWKPEKRYVKF